jgi:hypothetical protein
VLGAQAPAEHVRVASATYRCDNSVAPIASGTT